MQASEVEFASGPVRLTGTISLPDGAACCPALVLIGGSGASDRHNDGLFDALRDHLVSSGVAVLAYDKRGVGGSTGTWPGATVEELAGDAAAALARLRTHPGVDVGKVGLLGHSEGGWVGLRVCVRHEMPAFLILNSCPAVSFVESEIFALATSGVDEVSARAMLGELVTAARSGLGTAEAVQIFSSYKAEPWHGALEGFVLDEVAWLQLGAWCDYDPNDDLLHLRVPTFAVLGAMDPLVPVQVSLDRYRETAALAERVQRALVFADADHRLHAGASFAPGYLTSISTWCQERTEST